jgi:uncharacterized protein YxjI
MEQLTHVDLTDDQYRIEQSSVRNKYEAMDADGDTVLRGNHKMFEMQDEIHFTTADGTEVCTATANEAVDIASDYHLTDSKTGEDIVILDNDFSLLQDTWRIRDPADRSVVAEISSRGALVTLGRKLLPVGGWIPRKFEITDDNGTCIGSIAEEIAVRDRYDITIDTETAVPSVAIVAGAMVIDAIQGN